MKTMNFFKKTTAIILILTMALTMFTSCGKNGSTETPADVNTPEIVEDTEATIMRIVKVEGDVSHNENAAKEQERLHSKDTVGTEKSSNAYLTLDEFKAVRLDENSEIEVNEEKTGGERLLTLILNKGSLFFDVKQALPDNEFYNISTSNMTCGIRGTSGVIEKNEDNTTIYLISGKVEITSKDGKTKIELLAGNKAVIKNEIAAPEDIVVAEIKEIDVPDFVTKEDLTNIEFGNSETAPAADDTNVEEEETVETTVIEQPKTTAVKTFEALQTAIADTNSAEKHTITIDKNITISENLTIPQNVNLIVSSGVTVTVSPLVTFTVNGEMENNGTIIGA